MQLLRLLSFFLISALFACHPVPRDVRQTGHDALESARIQLDSGNKANALRLFKEAEHYGLLADDTLTVAHARFNIARCLGVYADEKEFVSLLKAADEGFGDDYAERARVMTCWGDYYQFHRQFDSAEVYLNRAMHFAEQSGSMKAKRYALSAFHVKCFNNREYERSSDYLWQYLRTYLPDVNDSVLMYYYHDMGNIYYKMGDMDSMAYCYGQLEELVTCSEPDCCNPNEDTWFYYGTLADFAEMRGDFEKACEYRYQYDKGDVNRYLEEKKNNLALISQKYDTAVMQNELNRKIIARQRWIIVISVLSALVLGAFLISQIRLARNRKREADINAELFHFKQQNQALAQKDAEHEQIRQDYADRLSEMLDKEQRIMLLLDNYLNNKRLNLLNDLEQSVFGDKDHWKAMLAVVEEKYPGLWETLGQKYPDLTEDEKKSFILSYFKVSRQEEADYLGTTVNMVDKIRGRMRKKMDNC